MALTKVREAHWKALATVAALEEEIEQLSQPVTRGQLETHAHSQSRNCNRLRSRGQKRKCHQVWPEDIPAPYFEYHAPLGGPESKEEEEAPVDFNLEVLPELVPEVDHFLQGPAESSEEEDRRSSSSEPPVEMLEDWGHWRAQTHNTLDWWHEITWVLGVDDYQG